MRSLRHQWGLLCLVGFVGIGACQQGAPDTREAEAEAIRATYATCVRAAQARDVGMVVECYAEDAVLLGPNAPIRKGKEAIREFYANWFKNPGYALSPTVTKLEVSRSGELAYDLGNFDITLADDKGRAVTDQGKFVHIWRKHADGSWKLVVAISNSDQPLSTR